MTDGDVRAFFKDDTAEPWFGELCKLMREGGLTTGLCLSRVAAVDAWQSLMGPLDPTEVHSAHSPLFSEAESTNLEIGNKCIFFPEVTVLIFSRHVNTRSLPSAGM